MIGKCHQCGNVYKLHYTNYNVKMFCYSCQNHGYNTQLELILSDFEKSKVKKILKDKQDRSKRFGNSPFIY